MIAMNELSIAYLLKQIRPQTLDGDILRRCKLAERLRREHDFNHALALAKATVEVATQSDNVTLGIALLYLAAIRHAVPQQESYVRAIEDCRTALVWLRRDLHHSTIAHLIRASLLTEDNQPYAALKHYRAADEIVTRLIILWHRRGKSEQEQYYLDLRKQIDDAITKTRLRRTISIDKNGFSSVDEVPVEQSPTSIIDSSSPSPSHMSAEEPESSTPLFYDIQRVWINGKEYLVETVQPISPENPGVRLLPDQKYIAVPMDDKVDSASGTTHYILIREKEEGAQSDKFTITFGPNSPRIWVEETGSTQPFPHIRIIDNVEAILSLTLPQIDAKPVIDKDLMICIDAIRTAQNLHQQPSKELEDLEGLFFEYLKSRYGIELIPIEPSITKFDEKNPGYEQVYTTQNPELKDGVIAAITQQGYTWQGKLILAAKVVVNKME